jgi:hypothetical protein
MYHEGTHHHHWDWGSQQECRVKEKEEIEARKEGNEKGEAGPERVEG